ncbi:hypothetical protein [Pajaroellobacter abortibovis]|uniref:Uncharacterized protein n=1 Tax=Pajaroellobacter abortibovis TaxID=1882918 RepID=A0A1L6MXR1_9BACT|nr:hypothetical protein [Pajaroellobacter abortibovis]APS00314.1 hypothetical protein BCY86_06195 [Pajaroellobacter abortibovis]
MSVSSEHEALVALLRLHPQVVLVLGYPQQQFPFQIPPQARVVQDSDILTQVPPVNYMQLSS